MTLRIGELSARTGESARTLRFWTDRGLLRAERAENTYRQYGADAVERVRFIRSAQTHGLTLEAVRRLLDAMDSRDAPCEHVLHEWTARLSEVRAAISSLQLMERALDARIREARASPCDGDTCRYLPRASSA